MEAALTPFLEVGGNNSGSNIEGGTLVLDITSALQRQQAGLAPGLGWALLPFTPDGTNGVDFYTREWTTASERPLLTVVTGPVPEPATLALWLSGMLALAWRSTCALDGVPPDADSLLAWVRAEGWGARHRAQRAPRGGAGRPG